MHRMPAALPWGMHAIAELIEGAVQQRRSLNGIACRDASATIAGAALNSRVRWLWRVKRLLLDELSLYAGTAPPMP